MEPLDGGAPAPLLRFSYGLVGWKRQMSVYGVICPLAGMEQMAQTQWVSMLRKLGRRVEVHALRLPDVDPQARAPKLAEEVLKNRPEALFVEGALGFNLPEFYQHPGIRQLPVAAFWYDDPFRTLSYWQGTPGYLETVRLPNVYHFVWDGCWREWLKTRHGIRSYPTHLAADPDDFFPKPAPREFADRAVFIGTFPARAHLEKLENGLPSMARTVLGGVKEAMANASYGRNPYEIFDEVLGAMPDKAAKAMEMMEDRQPEQMLHLRAIVQMLGKREVRRRVAGEALKVMPLLLLCGNYEETHAGEAEIRELLGESSDRLRVVDTRRMADSGLVDLYAHGRIHLQATDPQSVAGGIPFRVFQTTACRKPLLTDRKPELAECYEYERELLTFESDKDFAGKLARAAGDADQLDTVAEAGYRRFLREHTWRHRFEEVCRVLKTAVREPRPPLSAR
ncbi:MAG: glycosyltransferase [Verrucomicrobiae bacterium]|nr:glycosyltransferase [Verrucomicrobiae bacterium]